MEFVAVSDHHEIQGQPDSNYSRKTLGSLTFSWPSLDFRDKSNSVSVRAPQVYPEGLGKYVHLSVGIQLCITAFGQEAPRGLKTLVLYCPCLGRKIGRKIDFCARCDASVPQTTCGHSNFRPTQWPLVFQQNHNWNFTSRTLSCNSCLPLHGTSLPKTCQHLSREHMGIAIQWSS